MHQKCIRNLSQIQPSLPRSQSLKYYKNQNMHTYFFLYYLYLSQIYPKIQPSLPISHLLKYYKNPKCIRNASEMHQKCIRNLSQIQPSLPRSQSLKYYKNQNKHTYFFLYYLYLCKCPGTNVSRCPFRDNISRNISNHCILLRQLVPRHIHISAYITYIYPKFIPNSTFSPYISLTQIL